MAVMVRKQMYLEPRQDVQIKQLAQARSTTEAEVIREAINLFLSQVARQQRAQEAWDEALAFAEAWAAQEPVSGGRTWTREELYEERLNRYGQCSD